MRILWMAVCVHVSFLPPNLQFSYTVLLAMCILKFVEAGVIFVLVKVKQILFLHFYDINVEINAKNRKALYVVCMEK